MQKIGRYEILEELGRGSMGAVFKALDPQIGRTVAIKIILTANLPKEENELYRSRFYREAQAAGKMSHPGIVTIHDIAEDENGQPFLVMEYVEGSPLHRMLRPDAHGKINERLALSRTLDICAQVAEALEYAHSRGVVHRDIKPGNVIVAPGDRAKIADFGIARLSGTEATHTATVTGTPAYMSPEQFRGGTVDKRSDIFSLGSMLYWMATGEKPFPGDSLTQVSFNVVYREPAQPSHIVPDLPRDLEVVLSRCLAKRPEFRYASAGEAAADLRAVAEGKSVGATHAPAEATVEDTVVTMSNVTPVGMGMVQQAAAQAAETARRAARAKNVRIAAGLVVVAALSVGGWFWNQSVEHAANPPASAAPSATKAPADFAALPATPTAQPGPPSPAPAGAAQKSAAEKSNPGPGSSGPATKSPGPPATSSATKKAAPPAGSATIALDCRHGFKAATMEILAGGKPLFQTKLEGKPGAFGRTAGAVTDKLSIPPGKHSILVRVFSPADKYIEEKTIEADFAPSQSQTLEIRFGMRGRTLSLKWKK